MDELDGLIDKLSSAERRVLLALRELDGSEVDAIREAAGFTELVEVMNASSWLASKGMVTIGERVDRFLVAGPGAQDALEKGLPERRALVALDKVQMSGMAELQADAGMDKGEISIAMGWLKRRGWAEIRRVDGKPVLEITQEGMDAVGQTLPEEEMIQVLVDAGPKGRGEAELW